MTIRLSQRGDTLIEVAIAVAIIGFILFSAYTLSSQAFKLGRIARERTQAAQIMQAQAEGLRHLRDSAANWTAFRTLITSPTAFHVENTSTGWVPVPSATPWNPRATNPELPNFYTVIINGSFTDDKFSCSITVRWDRFGGGTQESSTLYYKLTDRAITF